MSTAHQGGVGPLSATQKAFEFADKLNYFFSLITNVEHRTSTINDTLLEYLGIEKYKIFCKNLKEKNKERIKNDKAFFKENFIQNPVNTDDIVTDYEVKLYWNGLVFITNEVIKLL